MTELGELGLSSYEEQVYRTLLVTGATTAADLSTASDVPRGRIYDVLNGLESRGLVGTQATEPTRYRAVEPAVAVDRLLAERTRELADEWERYRGVARSVRSNLLPTAPADASVWLGSLGSEEMQTAMREHTRTATDSVLATIGPPYEHAPWETFETEVAAFLDGAADGLSVSLVLADSVLDSLPERFPALVESAPGSFEIRAHPTVPVSFDVVDGELTTVDIPSPRDFGDRLAVVGISAPEVVDAFEREFEALWADATPLL
ncbi:TrmB family transcriptional regulator [Haloarchaeobius sp. FL176]|uniref:TrmB family transcriptional regulator n=1 Tax=Haloarchaeobius sp. FL176 TaxID=2967129 RepID=UPI0021471E02|nr:helix-turn-helix domain-containing protein [Haloarchaeobius sp. FL176]